MVVHTDILALGRWRQEDRELEVSLGFNREFKASLEAHRKTQSQKTKGWGSSSV
jgi:hypothetical protein